MEMGWACPDGWMSDTRYYTAARVENHMSKGNEGNQPERELEAEAKQALRTSV